MFDPFGNFSTVGYLRNVYGFQEKNLVSAAERFEVASNAAEAADFLRRLKPPKYDDVLKVHGILFGDLYPWAGQGRSATAPNIAITKAGIDDMFPRPGHERRAMDYALGLASNPSTMKSSPGEIMG